MSALAAFLRDSFQRRLEFVGRPAAAHINAASGEVFVKQFSPCRYFNLVKLPSKKYTVDIRPVHFPCLSAAARARAFHSGTPDVAAAIFSPWLGWSTFHFLILAPKSVILLFPTVPSCQPTPAK